MDPMSIELFSPMRITAPLPKVFSIWLIAMSRALLSSDLSRSTTGSLLLVGSDGNPPYEGGVTIRS